MRRYQQEINPEKSAKAFGFEMHCSPKDSMNLAYALRGLTLEEGKKFLEGVIALKQPLPAVYHKRKVHHQKGIGPASFPEKAARYMLEVLKNAENNAEYKGFTPEGMRISHISAYQGRVIHAIMPRAHGRGTDSNETTTDIEIILEEVE
jgi:large subunit ribosomal protein L22